MGFAKRRIIGIALCFLSPWIWTGVGMMLPPAFSGASFLSAVIQAFIGVVLVVQSYTSQANCENDL